MQIFEKLKNNGTQLEEKMINKFEESKNTKESEAERFRISLLNARNNSFKHLIRRIEN